MILYSVRVIESGAVLAGRIFSLSFSLSPKLRKFTRRVLLASSHFSTSSPRHYERLWQRCKQSFLHVHPIQADPSCLEGVQSVFSVPVLGGSVSNASGRTNANGQPGVLNTKTIADFQQFITEFREDEAFIYRDRLRANCLRKEWTLEVEMTHLIGWREDLASRCRSEPGEVISLVSIILSTSRSLFNCSWTPTLTVRGRSTQCCEKSTLSHSFERRRSSTSTKSCSRNSTSTEKWQSIDAIPRARSASTSRSISQYSLLTRNSWLQASSISNLVRLPGIVISASVLSSRAVRLHLTCKSCRHVTTMEVQGGFSGFQLPRKCGSWVWPFPFSHKPFMYWSVSSR